MRPLTELCQLAIKHKSDKGGRHLRYGDGDCHATHEYTPIYFDLLHKQREIVKNVLEIGVNKGCGLRMWRDFFPNAQVYGLDINRECLFEEERIKTAYADQNDPRSLHEGVLQVVPPGTELDLIVDDGSHQMMHQAISMKTLLPMLSDIGVYVIEDIPRDMNWAGYLAKQVPDGYKFGVVFPPLGAGRAWPELLFVITRE